MIIQEIVTVHNRDFKHTFSSTNKYIQQVETGALYDHAYDTMLRNFTYIETDQEVDRLDKADVPQD